MNAKHWLIVLLVSIGTHAGIAYMLLKSSQTDAGAAIETGVGGIDVGLGMLGSYQDMLETKLPVDEPTPKETPEVQELEVTEPPTKPVKAPEITTVVAPLKTPEIAVNQPQQKHTTQETKPAEPEPIEEPLTTLESPSDSQPDETETTSQQTTPAMTQATGQRNHRSAGGTQGDAKSYFRALMAWLNQFKEYPTTLKKQKKQGVVTLAFTIDRLGNITGPSIKNSSGYSGLDDAALEMLSKASPVPPLPTDLNRESIRIEIPVEYSLITNQSYKE